ncbi:vanadium-dependent haloperoxidase [Desertifilum sp. FACHB-1129]|uniref:Phosphoesterase n=1 Tax=Desertifilum tharense IPPAS B-1220 TaxID=1781255 RepID=A0A1E5QLS4_9CYAN|nr:MULTISPECIES: vanadium-dependent haloperoxidase [Desertifilum]MDA0212964.1 vanadium-dependent haloperoxidase [Cyanobacteria bacterium FC1]MBD2312466.1 vanadium-dependent haloperoxidase [Desertifilum sp. FACHB-1129]MBD2323408.1 vanadium-dependent haloperoxidase [Desertifilum sp. FACHB-866]MBD2333253.1 vanadium-dependent haloperoxidase [Desertifilum sp. FACHB-868]OEJ75639.1 phosphoesterase [Desertifilum tharense IPPAS B-1220]
MLELQDLFDESYYLSLYKGVAEAVANGGFTSGFDHYLKHGQHEQRNPSAFFNENYYLAQNEGVAVAVENGFFICGLDHYLKHGQYEQRDPSALFNESFYRRENLDVAAAVDPLTGGIVNCLEHYLRFGINEGRDPCARTVVIWDEVAQEAVRNTNPGPTIASRAYAIVHTAIFDAWAAYDPIAIATQLGDTLQQPESENTVFNKSEAISYAAYWTLVDLFPTQVDLFNSVMAQLGYDPQNTAPQSTTPSGIGYQSAQALLEYCHIDGSNQLEQYQDFTGYLPENSADLIKDPNYWQPLRLPNGQTQKFLTPHWGDIKPFGLTSGSQFRPPAPPAYGSLEFREQVDEVLTISANLTDTQKMIAEFWESGAGTSFPPGTWLSIGQFVSERDTHTLDQDVQLFFTLGNAVFDAGIAAWEAKRYYDFVRPISAIRYIYKDEAVEAWGGPGLGKQTINGSDWRPYLTTPPFSEYVSGHSTFSAASAEVLKRFTGSDVFGASTTIFQGTSRIESGTYPQTDITLSWATFSEAAAQAGMSRIYGGIHFHDGNVNGIRLGRQVGEQVWQRAQFFIQGGRET